MLDTGINEHDAVTLGTEGEILVLAGLAIEANQGTRLAEDGGKLVHDAALDAAVIVLGALADTGQFELIDLVAVEFVDCEGKDALQGRRRAEAGAQGHVAGENRIKSSHFAAALEGFPAHAKDITSPALRRLVLLIEAEFHILVEVNGEDLHFVRAIGAYSRHDTVIDGAGEHIAPIIVGMFANQVHATGRHENRSFSAEEFLEFLLDFLFHCYWVIWCLSYKYTKKSDMFSGT